jgi:vacuolar-type H+-ATPase subunit F/Vma7
MCTENPDRASTELSVTSCLTAEVVLTHRALDSLVFYLPTEDTTTDQIEAAFKSFTERDDVAIVLINQYVRH